MHYNHSLCGVISAVGAYLIWGSSPLLFRSLKAVSAFEILMHRMLWSCVLLVVFSGLCKRPIRLNLLLKSRAALASLTATTFLISFNWFLYIWAITNDRILDASLGYYICPLIYVLLGAALLGEQLRGLQWTAVILAFSAVFGLTVCYGTFPWVALGLGVSFAVYGLIRKTAPVEALEGVAVETALMFLPALGYLLWLGVQGTGAFWQTDFHTDLLLMGTALVTAVPLLLFTVGTRRIKLATIGILQYIEPSCTFIIAVLVYREPFDAGRGWVFGIIWIALALYTLDAVAHYHAIHNEHVTEKRK